MKQVLSEMFTKKKIINFLVNEMLGRFVGFMVGMWTTSLFSYYVYEKKSIKNMFGLAPRKKVLVNTTPEWLQWVISILIGFIVLELINYAFKNKWYVPVWEYIRKRWNAIVAKEEETSSEQRDMIKQ